MTSQEKFLKLLRDDILKLDLAELDFGIYRILRYRRDEIEQYLSERLPARMREALSGATGDQIAATREDLAFVRKALEEGAKYVGLDTAFIDGEVNPKLLELPKAKEYQRLTEKLEQLQAQQNFTQSEEDRLYNALYTFFSRYYSDGDFVTQSRRSREARYCAPYSGEDVHFHWKSRGSHYIKTAEEFKSYTFRDPAGGWRCRFELVQAEQEQNNVKGKIRYFFPLPEQATVDETGKLFVLPLAFRALTDDEAKEQKKEKTNGEGVQDKLLARGMADLSAKLPPALDRELFARHLRRYTRKNRSDYFVHPNLGAFLAGELDFYLKNEFLDAEAFTTPEAITDKFLKFQVLRAIGRQIIDFLDQLESFQAQLFEKRKFVIGADYLATVMHLSEDLWPDILKEERQVAAWRDLFKLEGKITATTLKTHPTLVVDTRLFSDTTFKARLLDCFPDIDDAVDGVLVHAENYAALRTLGPAYKGKSKIIYIDPPYNTGNDGFIYKDDFSKHSTWLTMMEERLRLGRELLADDGVIFVSIDDNEQARLKDLLDRVFGEENFVASVIWQKKYAPQNDAQWFSGDHDFMLVACRNKEAWQPIKLARSEEQDKAYANPDDDPRGPWKAGDYTSNKSKEERPNLYYPIVNPKIGEPVWPQGNRVWAYSAEQHAMNVAESRIWWGKDGSNKVPSYKRFLCDVGGVVPRTIWTHQDVGHNQDAVRELLALFADVPFTSPKPSRLVRQVLTISGEGLIIDFFAGSGTTGHAAIAQSRSVRERRKFFLAEMGDYFTSVLVPRLQKVIYSPEWKDGKPLTFPERNLAGWPDWVNRSPRLIKVLKLESYEDSLNALELPTERDERLHGIQDLFGDEYLLKYLLPTESAGSEVFLSTPALVKPFAYRLRIHTPDGVHETSVDLVETFNLLKGFHVQKLHDFADENRRYRVVEGLEKGQRALVVWRDADGLDPAQEREFLAGRFPLAEFSAIYTNADSALPNSRSLDAEFKRLMLERERRTA